MFLVGAECFFEFLTAEKLIVAAVLNPSAGIFSPGKKDQDFEVFYSQPLLALHPSQKQRKIYS